MVSKAANHLNDLLQVSILEQTLYGAGTSRLPQLCYLEGRALPEEYFFGEQPSSTPSALADIGIRAESALAMWRNMVPQYSHMDIRLAEQTLNGIFDKLQGRPHFEGAPQVMSDPAADHCCLCACRHCQHCHATAYKV